MEKIVVKIQEICNFYRETPSSFADKIGVPRSSISHLLSGRNKPSLDFVLNLVSNYPEVDLYWLLFDIGTFPKMKIVAEKIENTSTPTPKENPIIEEKKEVKELEKDLKKESNFDEKNLEMWKKINTISEKKVMEKVLFFYTDGTFDSFENNKK